MVVVNFYAQTEKTGNVFYNFLHLILIVLTYKNSVKKGVFLPAYSCSVKLYSHLEKGEDRLQLFLISGNKKAHN